MMKQKIKSYNFWISLTSVLVLFVRIVGEKFGFVISENDFMDIMVVLCTVFAVLGIFETPKSTSVVVNKDNDGVTKVDEDVLKTIDIYNEIKKDVKETLQQISDVVKTQNVSMNSENNTYIASNEEKSEQICVHDDNVTMTAQTSILDDNTDKCVEPMVESVEYTESNVEVVDNSVDGSIDVF